MEDPWLYVDVLENILKQYSAPKGSVLAETLLILKNNCDGAQYDGYLEWAYAPSTEEIVSGRFDLLKSAQYNACINAASVEIENQIKQEMLN